MLRSLDSNRVNGFSPGFLPRRTTVAGEPVPAKMRPVLSTANDQTKVDGVVASSVSPGPWRRCPSLSIEIPSGVPFSNSPICDCCHRWVPWADANGQIEADPARSVAKSAMNVDADGEPRRTREDRSILPLSLLEFGVANR